MDMSAGNSEANATVSPSVAGALRPTRRFWALIATQFQGAYSDDRFSKCQITIRTKAMEVGSMAVATAGLATHSLAHRDSAGV